MKASDAVALVLANHNVTYGFELIGGMITHLVDSINQLNRTKLISMHHEQGAAFAAAAVSRSTNHKELGVALGTSGPGATNLITGIADCWLDGHPCIFITGQVNTHELKGTRNIRQQGFQELDSVELVKSITKYAVQIKNADDLIPELEKAIKSSLSGRPGPVLIDIPMDIQRSDIEYKESTQLSLKPINNISSEISKVKEIILSKISNSKKPLFLLGGGVVAAENLNAFTHLLELSTLPYISSLKGAEKIADSTCYLGMVGAYGTRLANYAVQNCDLLIVIGSRLDVRQTGAQAEVFAENAEIIQIDIEEEQLNNRVKADISFLCDAHSLINEILIEPKIKCSNSKNWMSHFLELNSNFNIDEYSDWSISPYTLFNILNGYSKKYCFDYAVDVGNNQMWAAHTLRMSADQKMHHSGGLGTMGFAIPTSIGAYYGANKPIVVITGDGGAQLNIQELDVIVRDKLPILTIVFNNQSLGMVRGFQEMYFDGRNSSTFWGGYTSKFSKIATAYGLKSKVVASLTEFDEACMEFMSSPVPFLIEIMMPDARECRPRLEYGKRLNEQSPLLDISV